MATYTLEEAKAHAADKGIEWTPGLEAELRRQGKLVDAPAVSPKGTAPEWQAALAELIGAGLGRPNAAAPYQRNVYGSSAGDQLGAGVVSGLTARNIDAADMGVAPPTTGIGRFASGFGQGIGMGAAMMPVGRGVGMATQGIASPLLRAAATSAAGFGAYEGAAPAESLAERGVNVLKGAVMGGIAGGVPNLPGIRNVMQAAPALRPALDLATFTGMGGVEGMMQGVPAGEAFRQAAQDALPMMAGAGALHAVAGATKAPGFKPERGPVDPKTRRPLHRYVEGEPSDVPLVDYLNGKVDDLTMAKQMADFGTDPSAQVIRQVLQEGKVGSIDPRATQTVDRRRALRAAGGGEFDTPVVKEVLRVGQHAEMVREKMAADSGKRMLAALTSEGIKRNSPDAEALARISELATDTAKHPRELALTEAGAAIMAKAKNPEAVFKTFDAAQAEYARLGEIRQSGAIAIGEPPVDLRTYYQPRVEKQYKLLGNKGRDFIKAIEQQTRPQDVGVQTTGPGEVWSAREQQRARRQPLLKPEQISYDPFHIAEQYIKDTARTFTNRVAMKQGENVADLVRQRAKAVEGSDPMQAADLGATADAISAITQMAYNGKQIGLSGAVIDWGNSSRTAKVVRAGDALVKRAFNNSRYIANLRFMMGTQWTSVLMAAGQGKMSPDMVARAMYEFATPRLRDEYNLSYAHWAKTRNAGSIMHEGDLTAGRAENPLATFDRSKVAVAAEKIKESAGAPVRTIEDLVGRMAYALAEQVGLKAGMTGETLANFKSDSVGLTQSFYDRINRASVLSTPGLNTMFPAQGFNFDVGNTLFFDIKRGQLGAKSTMTKAEKAEATVRVMAALTMANMIYSLMGSQEESLGGKIKDAAVGSTVGTVPYANSILGLGPNKGRGFPAQMVEESVNAVKSFAEGDFDRGFAIAAGNLLPGGSQLKRAREADMMVERGVLPERELWMARMFGWQWTPSGKRYLRQLRGADTAKDRAYIPTPEQDRRSEDYRYQQSIKAEEKAAKKQAERDRQDDEYYRRGGR